jgi:small subunit ribosomal protein S8
MSKILVIDFLTRLRNAHVRGKTQVSTKRSKVTLALASLLVREGFLARVEATDDRCLQLHLKPAAFSTLEALSKPSLPVYVTAKKIPQALNGMGTVIVSTSQGLVTGKEARQRGIGGEVLCWIY